MADGLLSEESEGLASDMRVIEVDGTPTPVVGIRYKGGAPGQAEVTRDGKLTDNDEGLPPPDEYEEDREYWADRPSGCCGGARLRSTLREDILENRREAETVWAMFKKDSLSPVTAYWKNYGMPGMGLFLEGYVIFSISNNSTLFKQAYPDCWSKFTSCNETWTQATTYLQLIGVLLGQLTFGFLGDAIGRRATMLIDMSTILIGVIMLTVSNGATINGWVIMYAVAQFVFGFGIGGEYPMTSTRATEESEEDRQYAQKHRGRKVMLAYTMQGWGQFINLSVLLLLLNIFNHHGHAPYGKGSAGATWRVSFGILIPVVLYLIYYRIYVLKELKVLAAVKKRDNVEGYDWKSFRLLLSVFWHRLLGTGGIWFCNDWYFYGNGVFRSTFVGILVGSKVSVQVNWLYSYINAGVQLVGYCAAACTVDYRWIGRRRLTVFSFCMVAFIFAAVAGAYDRLIDVHHRKNIHVFQFLYYISSFFGLFGSHTTSFLLSAEMYPAQVRGTAHGISAATGKVGSIAVVVWLKYLGNRNNFWLTWPFALAGAVLCWTFVADNTGLDLAEQERRWFYIRNGAPKDYHGPAAHWRHLSRWERNVLGIHKQYDPVQDAQQRREVRAAHLTQAQEAIAAKKGLTTLSAKQKLADGQV